MDGTILLAFLGGIGSFFNPCSIVMIPTFIAFVSAESDNPKKGFLISIAYGLGFTLFFTLIGLLLLIPGFFAKQPWIKVIGGIFIIVMGIIVSTDLLNKKKNYQYEEQPENNSVKYNNNNNNNNNNRVNDSNEVGTPDLQTNLKDHSKYISAFGLGISHGTYGMGCVTPVLAGIVAGTNIMGLFIYAIGLIIPFVVLGLLLGKLNEFLVLKLIKFSAKIKIILGIILIIFGIYYLWDALSILGIF